MKVIKRSRRTRVDGDAWEFESNKKSGGINCFSKEEYRSMRQVTMGLFFTNRT